MNGYKTVRQLIVEKTLQIRSQKLIAYTKFRGYRDRTEAQQQSANKLQKHKRYTGQLTAGSHDRLCKAIDQLVQTVEYTKQFIPNPNGGMMPFKLAFTTLTIHSPDRMISAKEAHTTLLAPLLQWLRRVKNCNTYIWRAELQQRGQVHYHLLLGSFVHYKELRDKWNELQRKAGYLNYYYEEYGDWDAPSTEIKNMLKEQETAGYLCKEITKICQNESTVGGKIWDCSDNLKEMAMFEVDRQKYDFVLKRMVEDGQLRVAYQDKQCAVLKPEKGFEFNTYEFLNKFDGYMYRNFLQYIKTNSQNNPLKPPNRPIITQKIINVTINKKDWSDN